MEVILSPPVQVVPGSGLPLEVVPQASNNNLDVVDFDGRLFFVFRTGPTHFASVETTMYVVSSADERTWTFEAKFQLGTDIREPRFFAWEGRLWLYFAQLGSSPTAFEPGFMWRTERLAAGRWSQPEKAFEPGFIPWRFKIHEGMPYLVGYRGGENIYNFSGEAIEVYLLTTADGTSWQPVDPARPIVLSGGASETAIEFDSTGDLYAVARNEAGDEMEFGSKVCSAHRGDLANWICRSDPRKYDSPLLLQDGGDIYLVARRNLTATGHYDLGREGLSHQEKLLLYLADYSSRPKRCSIWRFNRDALRIDFVVDLPSRGDTCFPSAVPRGDGRWLLFNYTSPLDGPDIPWVDGQLGETNIYSIEIQFG